MTAMSAAPSQSLRRLDRAGKSPASMTRKESPRGPASAWERSAVTPSPAPRRRTTRRPPMRLIAASSSARRAGSAASAAAPADEPAIGAVEESGAEFRRRAAQECGETGRRQLHAIISGLRGGLAPQVKDELRADLLADLMRRQLLRVLAGDNRRIFVVADIVGGVEARDAGEDVAPLGEIGKMIGGADVIELARGGPVLAKGEIRDLRLQDDAQAIAVFDACTRRVEAVAQRVRGELADALGYGIDADGGEIAVELVRGPLAVKRMKAAGGERAAGGEERGAPGEPRRARRERLRRRH